MTSFCEELLGEEYEFTFGPPTSLDSFGNLELPDSFSNDECYKAFIDANSIPGSTLDDPFFARLFADLPEAPAGDLLDDSSFDAILAEFPAEFPASVPDAPADVLPGCLAECPSNDTRFEELVFELLGEFPEDTSFFTRFLGECEPMLLPDPFLPFMGSPDSEMTTPVVEVKQEKLYTPRKASPRIAGKHSKQENHREVYALAERAQAEEKAQRKAKRQAQAQPQPLNA